MQTDQCWAGNAVGYEQVDDSWCLLPCLADPTEVCGGNWRNGIYSTGIAPTSPTLLVTKRGYGEGNVTLSPTGNQYGETRMLSYAVGTVVTLTASANTGSTFIGWSGDCTGTGSCTVTMDSSKSVTATFVSANYVGCFTDDYWNPALAVPLPYGWFGDDTVESCIQKAANAGYAYAGVQYYGGCWGSNTVGHVQVNDSECNTPCYSDPTEMCGGYYHNSIYRTGVTP
jgi:uncharacterized repeat protein (TIGR02543 family)